MNEFLHRLKFGARLLLILSAGFLGSCSPKLYVEKSEDKLYPITANQPKDQRLALFLQPYKANLDSQMNLVIAKSAAEISKSKPEGPLNNLVADAMAESARQNSIPFDFAYTNYGGLRIGFPAGEIRMFRVFELMPFENLLTTVNFRGRELLQLFEYMAQNGGDPISGARFTIKDKKPINITIGGQALDPEKTYTVLTSDYMANGGDQAAFFKDATGRREYNIKLRDAILSYLKQSHSAGKMLDPRKDGRISVE